MAEQADAWAGNGLKRWGNTPRVVEMRSEAGAIATVHGALQTGPFNIVYVIAGFAADNADAVQTGRRTDAICPACSGTYRCHASAFYFGNHSDVMAVRQTGCAMLCAANVEEAQDFALISHIATLKSRVPFIHFFDGFRTSHEIDKILPLADDTILNLMPQAEIDADRAGRSTRNIR